MSIANSLDRVARGISCFSEWCGRAVAWLALAMALITTTVVVMRHLLNINSLALQDSVTYLHGAVFLLGAAFTLKRGGHVRVDIFYRRMTVRQQALVDALGGLLLLLPVCAAIFWLCLDYVQFSWQIREGANDYGKLPLVYLLKSLLLAMPVALALQGVADIIGNLLFFCGQGGRHAEPREGVL